MIFFIDVLNTNLVRVIWKQNSLVRDVNFLLLGAGFPGEDDEILPVSMLISLILDKHVPRAGQSVVVTAVTEGLDFGAVDGAVGCESGIISKVKL